MARFGFAVFRVGALYSMSPTWRDAPPQHPSRAFLAGLCISSWLFVSRLPITDAFASFVVLQRAQRYGYETEYLGWVLHRGEVIDAAADAGLELVREYAQAPPMAIEGAPDNPRHIGLLFRRVEG